eukprot:scaffold55425_cov72-Phaeocystis_antarctica.AAC.2
MAAPNLGAGDDGEVAAPTHSSTQKAASHLIRRGRITCGADTCGERCREDEGRQARVGRASVRKKPAGSGRASRDAACSGRASRPPRTTRTAGQHRGCTSRGLARCTCGGCGVRVWGARAWASRA